MASIYADKLSQKADYRTSLIEHKDKWKVDELTEKREVRVEAHDHTDRRDRALWAHEQKKSRLELKHQLQLIQIEKRAALLTELFRSNRPQSEMKSLMDLFDVI